MHIKYRTLYREGDIESVQNYVINRLDGSDYGRGELETIKTTLENQSESIARLIDLLATKEQLSARDVEMVVTGYNRLVEIELVE